MYNINPIQNRPFDENKLANIKMHGNKINICVITYAVVNLPMF